MLPNTSTLEANLSDDVLNSIHVHMKVVLPPVFLLVGLPGNLISLIIWSRRISVGSGASGGSTSLLLTVLCATDTYILLHGCMRHWILALTEIDVRFVLGCSLPVFVFTWLSELSVWIIMLLCLERLICVMRPMASKEICRVQNGATALLVICVLLAAVNAHFFWTAVPFIKGHNVKYCSWSEAYDQDALFKRAWPYIDFTIYSFLPLFVITVLNTSILMRLRLNHQRLRRNGHSRSATTSTGTSTSGRRRGSRILRTVMCMTISHFLFTMPIVIYFLATENHLCADLSIGSPSCELIEGVCVMLQLANHFTHFFIYSLTSSVFTEDLVQLLPFCGHIFPTRASLMSASQHQNNHVMANSRHHHHSHHHHNQQQQQQQQLPNNQRENEIIKQSLLVGRSCNETLPVEVARQDDL